MICYACLIRELRVSSGIGRSEGWNCSLCLFHPLLLLPENREDRTVSVQDLMLGVVSGNSSDGGTDGRHSLCLEGTRYFLLELL